MCARFGLEQGILPFLELLGIDPEKAATPPPNIMSGRPTDPVAVVLRNPKSREMELRYPRWGLVPHGSKGPLDRDGKPMINARAETIADLKSFATPFRRRRCIMPMVGFHESSKAERSKHFFTMRDGSPMGVAAIWDYRVLEDGKSLVSCAMITCGPNELVAKVHHRMPAVLRPEDYLRWLDLDLQNPDELSSMLGPMDSGLMDSEFVGMLASAKRAERRAVRRRAGAAVRLGGGTRQDVPRRRLSSTWVVGQFEDVRPKAKDGHVGCAGGSVADPPSLPPTVPASTNPSLAARAIEARLSASHPYSGARPRLNASSTKAAPTRVASPRPRKAARVETWMGATPFGEPHWRQLLARRGPRSPSCSATNPKPPLRNPSTPPQNLVEPGVAERRREVVVQAGGDLRVDAADREPLGHLTRPVERRAPCRRSELERDSHGRSYRKGAEWRSRIQADPLPPLLTAQPCQPVRAMKRIEIGGTIVEVDEARTAEIYEQVHDWCQCDGHTNARMARAEATPPEQAATIAALGLDLRNPYYSSYARGPRPSRRFSRHNDCWVAYGRIVGAGATPRERHGRWGWIRADSDRGRATKDVESLFWSELDKPGLVYIVSSVVVPWLYGEVCGFRSDYVGAECPECGSTWRQTGYLKRRSLIPEWKGLPHLADVLREREKRVFVSFCSTCGRMEHEIVEDRPPFRTKSTLYRDEERRRATYGSNFTIVRKVASTESGVDEQ